ncbi:UNKNOWN [Stylonychia lemnae]|uniref:Uncharacterized protein n=1 Tax=Stylonychia lemnae TaxID=5949 RepID=A0A078ALR4_STYLE|nr:UNKNOWN [Stylonychia lemnae]|eukprot:CDW81788.1 UNKNOWN [Stylonychia lemnae]
MTLQTINIYSKLDDNDNASYRDKLFEIKHQSHARQNSRRDQIMQQSMNHLQAQQQQQSVMNFQQTASPQAQQQMIILSQLPPAQYLQMTTISNQQGQPFQNILLNNQIIQSNNPPQIFQQNSPTIFQNQEQTQFNGLSQLQINPSIISHQQHFINLQQQIHQNSLLMQQQQQLQQQAQTPNNNTGTNKRTQKDKAKLTKAQQKILQTQKQVLLDPSQTQIHQMIQQQQQFSQQQQQNQEGDSQNMKKQTKQSKHVFNLQSDSTTQKAKRGRKPGTQNKKPSKKKENLEKYVKPKVVENEEVENTAEDESPENAQEQAAKVQSSSNVVQQTIDQTPANIVHPPPTMTSMLNPNIDTIKYSSQYESADQLVLSNLEEEAEAEDGLDKDTPTLSPVKSNQQIIQNCVPIKQQNNEMKEESNLEQQLADEIRKADDLQIEMTNTDNTLTTPIRGPAKLMLSCDSASLRKRGRPKGSKNKSKKEQSATKYIKK